MLERGEETSRACLLGSLVSNEELDNAAGDKHNPFCWTLVFFVPTFAGIPQTVRPPSIILHPVYQ